MELWDVYDINRNKTGKTAVRGEGLPEGGYHLVVHVCIIGSDGRMLIQQRQPFKHGFSNLWDVSAELVSPATAEPPALTSHRFEKPCLNGWRC